MSEKSYAGYDLNVYTFVVAARRQQDRDPQGRRAAVRDRVEKVHTINRKGKRSRNRTPVCTRRARAKRAIVTLAAGEERIDIFGS